LTKAAKGTPMEERASIQDKSYDFFISYYHGTGFAFAKYLKEHAKDFNRTAFLDKEDIHSDIKEGSDEWRLQVDRGIAKSKNFVLIMTIGFKDRPEIKREWKKAIENRVRCFIFKKDVLKNQDLIVRTDNEQIDFSKYHYTSFSNEFDLLESVEARIREPIIEEKSANRKYLNQLLVKMLDNHQRAQIGTQGSQFIRFARRNQALSNLRKFILLPILT
jgi:hypothetical protein